jgi:hypothetical protein
MPKNKAALEADIRRWKAMPVVSINEPSERSLQLYREAMLNYYTERILHDTTNKKAKSGRARTGQVLGLRSQNEETAGNPVR